MKVLVRVSRYTLGLMLVVGALAAPAFGEPPPSVVPEIGLGSAASAVALLSGGYLVLSSRFRNRK